MNPRLLLLSLGFWIVAAALWVLALVDTLITTAARVLRAARALRRHSREARRLRLIERLDPVVVWPRDRPMPLPFEPLRRPGWKR